MPTKSNDTTKDMGSEPTTVNKALNWSGGMHLTRQAKSIRFAEDGEGNLWAYPVVLIDPNANTSSLYAAPNVIIRDPNQGIFANVEEFTRDTLGSVAYNTGALLDTYGVQCVYNNSPTPQYETVKTPTTWKTLETAAAAATATIWTPSAGKKFRVLGGTITMGGTIAAAAKRSLTLIEETAGTVIIAVGIDIPILGNNIAIPFDFRPNGFLASTVDKSLQVVTAGATYVTGSDWVSVWGVEQ